MTFLFIHRSKKYFLAAFCIKVTFLCATSFAENPSKQFQLFTANEGLPQNYIMGLTQDSSGFIWIGTKDGLARFDGYNFKIYRHGKDSLHTPAGNNITNLYTDYHGYVWIQYFSNDIDRYDPSTGIFHHVTSQPVLNHIKSKISSYSLIVDHHNYLWMLGYHDGFYRFDLKQKQILHFDKATGILNDSSRAIMEDHKGKVWMVSNNGFNVYDPGTGKTQAISYTFNNLLYFAGRDFKFGCGELDDGSVVVTQMGGIGSIYNPANNSFKKISTNLNNYPYVDMGTGNTDLIKAANDDRWFNTNGKIFKISKGNNLVTEFPDPTNPKVPEASAILIDKSGTLWFGKNGIGLCKVNLNNLPFISKNYIHNFETDIVTRELGVSFSALPKLFSVPSKEYLYRNSFDTKNQIIWIQNFSRDTRKFNFLQFYDISTKKISKEIPLTIQVDIVGIDADAHGNAWLIGTTKWQVLKLNYSSEKITQELIDLPFVSPDVTPKKTAVDPVIDNNTLWIMNSGGTLEFATWELLSADLISKKIQWHQLRPDNIEAKGSLLMMVRDPAKQPYLWIGSLGNGLIRFNKITGQCHAFTTDEGLPNNTVYAIVPDDAGNLWLSTNRGLCRFNPVNNSVRNFDVTDGLINNEFNRWHCFKFPDERIAFGGVTGYTIFNPADIKDDNFEPQVLLSDFQINNNPVPDSSAITDSIINALHKLVLPYDQNFLTFEFASNEYNRPDKIAYRYKLDNFDENWVYAKNIRIANYTKLPPGKYVLRLNASNTSGIWSNKIKKLQIIINLPWWQTWWAYTIYAISAALFIWLFFRYRLKQIHMQQAVLFQQKETQQLKAMDEIKTRFFSNITHEFRTPLSLIISPVEKLQQQIKEENIAKTLSSVQRNAQQLLRLVNQLLDMSKLEAGGMKVNYSYGQLGEFAKQMTDNFLAFAERKNIALTCTYTLTGEHIFDAEKLETVLFNLLSNAVKFTPDGGKIFVSVEEKDEGLIQVEVSDTGIGISSEKLPFIFNRFYQADDSRTRQYEGTGIGLALVKELTELVGGSVTVKSKPDEGTTFTINFPADKWSGQMLPQWQKDNMHTEILKENPATVSREENQNKNENLPLILLVEDNEELLSFLKEGLQTQYRIITASKGVDALRSAQQELPDIMISDVMMPGMDGYTLCEKIKKNIITNHIAVILLTAKVSHESHMHGLMIGADDYINKPFHLDELQARISNLINRQEKLKTYYQRRLQHADTVKQEAEDPFLKTVYDAIEECIDDTQFDIPALAVKCAVSQRTLNRKLHALLGLPANIVIRQYRLQKSLSLLKKGFSVSETAYAVGFETPSYYSQCFKDQYGVAPKEYI